jgi:multiple sugar transport system ATP-binding protein
MAEITIKGVAKSFGGFQALHSIDLGIADQEFMVLLGASGCGKTTLLRIIAGLETPTEGEVWIGDRRVDRLPPRERGIAMVFQNYAVFPHLTVFENIAFGLRMKKLPQAEIERRVSGTAELMHIDQLLKRYSGQLSGGQRQRVAVARALAMEPDVILMDEPLSNLDALLRLEMRAELKGVLAGSKTTTIYVTHDQVEAMSLADRISVMNGGHIVQADSPVEIYRNPAARFVGSFIGNPPMNFLPAARLGAGRWRVAGLMLAGPEAESRPVEFAIRPEDVIVAPNGFTAVARVVEPLGAHTLVTADVEGALFRAVLDSDIAVRPGDALSLVPKPDRIRWFDAETSLAVGGAPATDALRNEAS